MPKKPYIPLYVGDWVKDTDCISLEAEGALLKFIFKMWESEIPGSLSIRFSQIAILLKKTEEIARKIVQELHENRILDIEFIGDSAVKIESRRMLREARISQINSENGSQGGRPVKKGKAKLKQINSDSKAKVKRNADIDTATDIDTETGIDSELEKGGVGEKEPKSKKRGKQKTNFADSIWADKAKFISECPDDWSEAKREHYFKRVKHWSEEKPNVIRANWVNTAIDWDDSSPWQEPKSKPREEQPGQADTISELIRAFNQYAGMQIDESDIGNRGSVADRLMAGADPKDMHEIIQLKCMEWGQGENRKYLRIAALFSDKNYQNFLQEVRDIKAGKKQPNLTNQQIGKLRHERYVAALGQDPWA